MQIVLALIGMLIGATLDEWRGALLCGVLGFVLGELWTLRQRIADLSKSIADLRRKPDAPQTTITPPAVQPIRETLAAARTTSSPRIETPVTQPVMTQKVPVEEPVAISNPWKPAPREEFAPIRWLREFFTGGNTIVRVSGVILFVGVALLLKYASEHAYLSIEVRLIGVAIGAIALLILGWRLRKKRQGYAVALQGIAVGVLYLNVFAALRRFALLPPTFAFALLLALVLLSAALAVLQDAMWLALLGISGGFVAPILVSTGSGNHVALFTFYAILNIGIVAIAWFKAWRPLNVAGFAFTFVIGVVWGVQRYNANLFASTEPFLIAFFLMYVAIAILFASRQVPNLKGYVDGTIVFGVPIAAFALQSALLYQERYWLAVSAIVVSAIYLELAFVLWRRATWRLLSESFIALSVAFATLAIPLALNGRWSAASWALEGAALVWVGCRQSRVLPRLAGFALQFAGAAHFLRDSDVLFNGLPILNSTCLGALIIATSAVFSSRTLLAYAQQLRTYERSFANVLFFWGLLWWLIAGVGEIDRRIVIVYKLHALLGFVAATSVLCSELQHRLKIAVARWPALWLLPAMILFALIESIDARHAFANFGWLAWPVAFTTFYFTLHRHELITNSKFVEALHIGGIWLLAFVPSRELAWLIDHAVNGAGSWPAITWSMIPACIVIALPRMIRTVAWPIAQHANAYLIAAGGFVFYLVLWSLFTSIGRNGDPYPLPYIPIINPLDIAELIVLLAGIVYLRRLRPISVALPNATRWGIFGAVTFIWLNAILLRTIHYWAGVSYVPHILWGSTLVQTALSIFWTALALATMLVATRRAHRILWGVGAALMAVVVVKLFLIDLSRVGSIARIVSFIGVGLMMLVIGYFTPIPPQREEQAQ